MKGHNSGTNLRKMTCNNPKLDLVNMNAYIKFGENMSVLKILSGNEISAQIKGHNCGTNVRKMTCNNLKLDFVNMNAYIKFGEILSIGPQDIEWKQNFGVNKGP